jgi:hypothetical protein
VCVVRWYMLPSSGKEATNLVNPLERVILSHWATFRNPALHLLLPENTKPSEPFISSYSQSLGAGETLGLLSCAPENRSRPWIVRESSGLVKSKEYPITQQGPTGGVAV